MKDGAGLHGDSGPNFLPVDLRVKLNQPGSACSPEYPEIRGIARRIVERSHPTVAIEDIVDIGREGQVGSFRQGKDFLSRDALAGESAPFWGR